MISRGAGTYLVIAAAACAAACTPRVETPDPADLQAARQAALVFDVRLKSSILDRLDRDEDPVAVYMAYRDNVRAMLAEAGEQSGVEIKRTGLLIRNPENAPDDWERRQLEEFEFLVGAGFDPETLGFTEIVREGDTRVLRWMRPLTAGETCLVCHGEEIEPRLLDLIERDYPDDEAVGFFAEELRGAYSVRRILD